MRVAVTPPPEALDTTDNALPLFWVPWDLWDTLELEPLEVDRCFSVRFLSRRRKLLAPPSLGELRWFSGKSGVHPCCAIFGYTVAVKPGTADKAQQGCR